MAEANRRISQRVIGKRKGDETLYHDASIVKSKISIYSNLALILDQLQAKRHAQIQ